RHSHGGTRRRQLHDRRHGSRRVVLRHDHVTGWRVATGGGSTPAPATKADAQLHSTTSGPGIVLAGPAGTGTMARCGCSAAARRLEYRPPHTPTATKVMEGSWLMNGSRPASPSPA